MQLNMSTEQPFTTLAPTLPNNNNNNQLPFSYVLVEWLIIIFGVTG